MLGSYYNFEISTDDHIAYTLFKVLEEDAIDPQAHNKSNASILDAIKRLQNKGLPLTVQALKKKGEYGAYKGWALARALAYKASQSTHPQDDDILIPALEKFLPQWSLTDLREVIPKGNNNGETLLWIITHAQNPLFCNKIGSPLLHQYIDELSLTDVRYAPADGPHRGVTVLANLAENYSDHFVFVVDRLKDQLTLEDLTSIPTVLGDKAPKDFNLLRDILMTEALMKKTVSQANLCAFLNSAYELSDDTQHIELFDWNNFLLTEHFLGLFSKYNLEEAMDYFFYRFSLAYLAHTKGKKIDKILTHAVSNQNQRMIEEILVQMSFYNDVVLLNYYKLMHGGHAASIIAISKRFPNLIPGHRIQQAFQEAIVGNQLDQVSILVKHVDHRKKLWAIQYTQEQGLSRLHDILANEMNSAAEQPSGKPSDIFPLDVWRYMMDFMDCQQLKTLMKVNKYFRWHVSRYLLDTYFPKLKQIEKEKCEKQPGRIDRYVNDPVSLWVTTIKDVYIMSKLIDIVLLFDITIDELLLALKGEVEEEGVAYVKIDVLCAISAANRNKECYRPICRRNYDDVVQRALEFAMYLENVEAICDIASIVRDRYPNLAEQCLIIMSGERQKIQNLITDLIKKDEDPESIVFEMAIRTPLFKKQDDAFEWAIRNVDVERSVCLSDALELDNLKAVEVLLKYKNFTQRYLCGLLRIAAVRGQREIAQLLFDKILPSNVIWFFDEAVRNNWPEFIGRIAPMASKNKRDWAAKMASALGYTQVLQELKPFQDSVDISNTPRLFIPQATQQRLITKEPEQATTVLAAAASSSSKPRNLSKL